MECSFCIWLARNKEQTLSTANCKLSGSSKETCSNSWNVAPVVCIAATAATVGLAGILGVINNPDIIHSFGHDKSSSITQLINGKSRDLQKLLKYLNETISVCNISLLFCVFPIIYVL